MHELDRDLCAVCRLEESLLRVELRFPVDHRVSGTRARPQGTQRTLMTLPIRRTVVPWAVASERAVSAN